MLFIQLKPVPNQTMSTMLDDLKWEMTFTSRLGSLFATLHNERDGTVVHNRICLNGSPITEGLFFIDIEGDENPNYTGLDSRFFLVYVS